MNTRFEAINARFEAMNARFEAMNMRFEAMERRFNFLQWLIVGGFSLLGILLTLIKLGYYELGGYNRKLKIIFSSHLRRCFLVYFFTLLITPLLTLFHTRLITFIHYFRN
ncbi:MAG: hypothetical protein NZ530_00385 [Thermodesulfobacteriaceae bacterium]|nr:hypothetical protein [Thermodesulfobacteriaceae bacterium]